MSSAAGKLACIGLTMALLFVLGAASGVWLAANYYGPLLDTANADLVKAKLARDNLEELAGEQGRKLGELVAAGELRELNAARAIAKAKEEAQTDYAAANRLMQGRSGGDPAEAAASIIDQELGL